MYVWVFISASGSQNRERLDSWNTTKTKYTLELDWAQNYTVTVSAWNKYGESSVVLKRHFTTGRVPQGKNHLELLVNSRRMTLCLTMKRKMLNIRFTQRGKVKLCLRQAGTNCICFI